MSIKLKKTENGFISSENTIIFEKEGPTSISVECDGKGCDEVFLKNEALAYLNREASKSRMRVNSEEGLHKTIPVKVNKGDSARVRFLEFPVEITPDERLIKG